MLTWTNAATCAKSPLQTGMRGFSDQTGFEVQRVNQTFLKVGESKMDLFLHATLPYC